MCVYVCEFETNSDPGRWARTGVIGVWVQSRANVYFIVPYFAVCCVPFSYLLLSSGLENVFSELQICFCPCRRDPYHFCSRAPIADDAATFILRIWSPGIVPWTFPSMSFEGLHTDENVSLVIDVCLNYLNYYFRVFGAASIAISQI